MDKPKQGVWHWRELISHAVFSCSAFSRIRGSGIALDSPAYRGSAKRKGKGFRLSCLSTGTHNKTKEGVSHRPRTQTWDDHTFHTGRKEVFGHICFFYLIEFRSTFMTVLITKTKKSCIYKIQVCGCVPNVLTDSNMKHSTLKHKLKLRIQASASSITWLEWHIPGELILTG